MLRPRNSSVGFTEDGVPLFPRDAEEWRFGPGGIPDSPSNIIGRTYRRAYEWFRKLLRGYYTKEETDALLATKYVKPSGGIPASDLAPGVIPPPANFDDEVTQTSSHGVKSSGIWSAIWGALAAIPTGFSSLYDWCAAQIAALQSGKRDKTDLDVYELSGTYSGLNDFPEDPLLVSFSKVEPYISGYVAQYEHKDRPGDSFGIGIAFDGNGHAKAYQFDPVDIAFSGTYSANEGDTIVNASWTDWFNIPELKFTTSGIVPVSWHKLAKRTATPTSGSLAKFDSDGNLVSATASDIPHDDTKRGVSDLSVYENVWVSNRGSSPVVLIPSTTREKLWVRGGDVQPYQGKDYIRYIGNSTWERGLLLSDGGYNMDAELNAPENATTLPFAYGTDTWDLDIRPGSDSLVKTSQLPESDQLLTAAQRAQIADVPSKRPLTDNTCHNTEFTDWETSVIHSSVYEVLAGPFFEYGRWVITVSTRIGGVETIESAGDSESTSLVFEYEGLNVVTATRTAVCMTNELFMTKGYVDGKVSSAVSTNNPAFVSAVRNTPTSGMPDDMPTDWGTYGTVGAALAALAAFVKWAKAKIVAVIGDDGKPTDDFAADLLGKQVSKEAVQDIIADDVIPVTGDTSLTKTIATIGGKAIKAPEGGGGGGGLPNLFVEVAGEDTGDEYPAVFEFDGIRVETTLYNNYEGSDLFVVPCAKVKLVSKGSSTSAYGYVKYNNAAMVVGKEYTVTNGDSISVYTMSCLVGDTVVSVPGGGFKRIDELEVGDKILAMSPDGKIVEDTITTSDIHAEKRYCEAMRWEFEHGYEVTTVHRHRLYNVEREAYVYLDEWKFGEHARTIDGQSVALLRSKTLHGDFKHYCCVGKMHTHFVNGLLDGDRNAVPPKF